MTMTRHHDHVYYRVGQPLPRDVQYVVIDDYNRYGLVPPPYGTRYVRIGDDFYRVNTETNSVDRTGPHPVDPAELTGTAGRPSPGRLGVGMYHPLRSAGGQATLNRRLPEADIQSYDSKPCQPAHA